MLPAEVTVLLLGASENQGRNPRLVEDALQSFDCESETKLAVRTKFIKRSCKFVGKSYLEDNLKLELYRIEHF